MLNKTEEYISFRKRLSLLLEKSKEEKSLSLKTILTILSGKGKILLLIFLCIPFGQIFGLAIPFGLLIAYLGILLAFGRKKIWLPKWLIRKKIPSKILIIMAKQLLYCIKKLGKLSYPRYSWMSLHPTMRKINGIVIAFMGLFLALSLPIPLSSYIASAAILFIGIGILNDDGIMISIGYPLAITYISFVIITLKFNPFKKIIDLIFN